MDWEEKTKSRSGQESYDDLVKDEISFSKATGYDKEMTAVVPLAQLARREEERLKRIESQGRADQEAPEEKQRVIPVGEIIDVLRAARSVEEVAGVLVEMVANLVPRVLLLWEKNDVLYGFASRGMGLEEVKLLTIELPREILRDLTCLNLDLDSFRGPPRMTDMVKRLYEILGGKPKEVLVVPVYVTPEDRWILYGDNFNDALPAFELRLVEVIVSRAGARADLLMDGKTW
ncbi:MAG: hypothetical protein JRJ87_15410 [Deltaproteobacteria bacterium]|nr:hypothetical protein [Deltaproteobacteria bacterium]